MFPVHVCFTLNTSWLQQFKAVIQIFLETLSNLLSLQKPLTISLVETLNISFAVHRQEHRQIKTGKKKPHIFKKEKVNPKPIDYGLLVTQDLISFTWSNFHLVPFFGRGGLHKTSGEQVFLVCFSSFLPSELVIDLGVYLGFVLFFQKLWTWQHWGRRGVTGHQEKAWPPLQGGWECVPRIQGAAGGEWETWKLDQTSSLNSSASLAKILHFPRYPLSHL